MEKSLGGKVWMGVQYACVFYAGQELVRTVYKKLQVAADERRRCAQASEKVDLASEDSFPASDPPAWGGHSAGPIH